jgi:adenylate cyclase
MTTVCSLGSGSTSATSWSRAKISVGDGVNVAARLEGIAEPGSICISYIYVRAGSREGPGGFQGSRRANLKNIARPIRAIPSPATQPYAKPEGENTTPPRTHLPNGVTSSEFTRQGTTPPLPDKPSIAVLPFQNLSGDPSRSFSPMGWRRTSSPTYRAFASLR